MAYIFMAVHYPEPGRAADLYSRMKSMAASLDGVPGLLEMAPWIEHGGERVVGLSRWESREASESAMPGSGQPNEIVHEWEAGPREYFHLTQPGS